VKLRFLVGLARGVADTIGTTAFPPVRETLGKLASQAATVASMVYGMEAAGRMRGAYYLPDRHLLYAAQVQAQEMYPQIIQAIRELAGGALLMLPSSVRDFADPDLARIIRSTQVSPATTGMQRIKLLKLVWDAVGSEFASRHLQYESFYAGAQFVTRGHSFRTYDWDAAGEMVRTVMDRYPAPTPSGEA
jgi:4-hydroxyphenylacetate 3-monooxygenase